MGLEARMGFIRRRVLGLSTALQISSDEARFFEKWSCRLYEKGSPEAILFHKGSTYIFKIS